MYIRNVVSEAWDKLSASVCCLEEYEETLIAGDLIGNNGFPFSRDSMTTIYPPRTTGRTGI
jgi:hypothetical protein